MVAAYVMPWYQGQQLTVGAQLEAYKQCTTRLIEGPFESWAALIDSDEYLFAQPPPQKGAHAANENGKVFQADLASFSQYDPDNNNVQCVHCGRTHVRKRNREP